MGKIVWLASYPKSGNTWLRMLLNNYFWGKEEKQDLNRLDLTTYGGSSKSSYRQVTSLNVDTLSDQDIMGLTPSAHAYIASKQDGLVFVKTHNILSTYFDIPLITPEVTQGVLYVIRNPLDTVLSVADHYGLDLDRAINFINNVNGSTAPNETMVRQIFSSWTKNVEHWTLDPRLPVLAIRYEDLHAQPLETFTNVIKFLHQEPDVKLIARAVKQSSFKSLKNMEKRDGFDEKSRHSKAFFRSGKTGQWKAKLSKDQIDKVVQGNYVQMKRFGYLPTGY